MDYEALLRHGLRIDEDRRTFPYMDTTGNITIGIGYNLTADGLPDDVIDLLFDRCIARAEHLAESLFPDFALLNDVRKYVVCNMAFNLAGKLADFQRFRLAVHEQRWSDAKREMLNSQWASQVGDRAKRLADAMESGEILPDPASS